MKTEGKSRAELQEKVMGWYGELEGEAKEKAGELLKDEVELESESEREEEQEEADEEDVG
jgi:hypothetical protein